MWRKEQAIKWDRARIFRKVGRKENKEGGKTE